MEFEIIATSDTLSFNYVFASNEYESFENTVFNDVFGFFISGPGISGPYSSPPQYPNGSVNIAVVPNSSPDLPITISSVNSNLNSEYYIQETNFNNGIRGYTTKLESKIDVQCGETYHLRIAIGDGTDFGVTSHIFLESNSLIFSDIILENNFNQVVERDTIYLNCVNRNDYGLYIQHENLNDFELEWSTGDTTSFIQIQENGDYYVILKREECILSSDTIHIVFPIEPVLDLGEDKIICTYDSVLLIPNQVSDHVSYLWSNGSLLDEVYVKNSGVYSLTITDSNYCNVIDSLTVDTFLTPNAIILGSSLKCPKDSAAIQLLFSGSPPFNVNYGLSQNQFIDTTILTETSFYTKENGSYTIFSFKDKNCKGNFSVIAEVYNKELNDPLILSLEKSTFCQVDSSVQFFASPDGGYWSGKGVDFSGVFSPINAKEGES